MPERPCPDPNRWRPPQAEQCLGPNLFKLARARGVPAVPVLLDKGEERLNAISTALGVPSASNLSFSMLMHGGQRWGSGCYRSYTNASGGPLMRQVARALAPSYQRLREAFDIVYESEAALERAANSRFVEVCHGTYALRARNTSDSAWTILLAGISRAPPKFCTAST